jgi:hypothetical protein
MSTKVLEANMINKYFQTAQRQHVLKDDQQWEVPGTKARFHLVRTVKVTPEILARYVGAYRFRNGDYLVIDSFPDTPDTLWVTDVKSRFLRV